MQLRACTAGCHHPHRDPSNALEMWFLFPGHPLPCTNKTASQQRGLLHLGRRISSKPGFRLQSRSPEQPQISLPPVKGKTHFFLSLHHIDTHEHIVWQMEVTQQFQHRERKRWLKIKRVLKHMGHYACT